MEPSCSVKPRLPPRSAQLAVLSTASNPARRRQVRRPAATAAAAKQARRHVPAASDGRGESRETGRCAAVRSLRLNVANPSTALCRRLVVTASNCAGRAARHGKLGVAAPARPARCKRPPLAEDLPSLRLGGGGVAGAWKPRRPPASPSRTPIAPVRNSRFRTSRVCITRDPVPSPRRDGMIVRQPGACL